MKIIFADEGNVQDGVMDLLFSVDTDVVPVVGTIVEYQDYTGDKIKLKVNTIKMFYRDKENEHGVYHRVLNQVVCSGVKLS